MAVWVKAVRMTTALVVLALGAGCAAHPAEPVPTAEVADAVHCVFGDQEGPAAGRVPDGFDPVAVYRCNINATVDDTEGRWSAVVIDRLTGDLGPLLRALARPDDARSGNPCPAMAELVPDLWLADASGHAVRVHYPRTSCGFTKPAVRAALDVVTVVNTRTEKVQLVESRVALGAGCATTGSPLMLTGSLLQDGIVLHEGISADPGIASTPAPGLTQNKQLTPSTQLTPSVHDVDSLRVCRYERDRSTSAGATPLAGTFVGAGELRGDQVRAVLAAARAGGTVADPCDAQADRFAMLLPIRDGTLVGPALTVELDGCRRIASLGMAARAATEEVLRLVS